MGNLATALCSALGHQEAWRFEPDPNSIEMKYLAINSSEAAKRLSFSSKLRIAEVDTADDEWYAAYLQKKNLRDTTLSQIAGYQAA